MQDIAKIVDNINKEIQERRRLLELTVGNLYPAILHNEIISLQEAKQALEKI